ncbi:Nitroreductase [Frankia sp. Hr75.2]|uniref:nitroreductase family protein n=1 Tax=Parafrankia sp. Ea1.12 TaxID=573499 RepID=UPI000DA4EB14|nr:nitroreductase family protein [Parafrankia sp. Ea1.12]CAI7974725.1 Nitroreductase [Frankia sp. Hr75.2]SQD97518.1 Nitroreductase [Parafrankia sp. Ea1.12]
MAAPAGGRQWEDDPVAVPELTPEELLTTTRSVRKRLDLDRPVAPELIEECLRIALQAPSGSNRQGWHWIVVTDPELRAGIAGYYRKGATAYLAAGGASAAGYEGERAATQARVSDSARYLAENMHRVPVLLIPCLEGDVTQIPPQVQAGFWGSLLPAVWSFMLAARLRGLGTAWTSLHLGYSREVAELLGIPPGYSQGALIPVAHTIGTTFRPAAREPLETVLHRDRW